MSTMWGLRSGYGNANRGDIVIDLSALSDAELSRMGLDEQAISQMRTAAQQLDDAVQSAVTEHRWSDALSLLSSERRVGAVKSWWPGIPVSQRSQVLAQAITDGDYLRAERYWLQRVLRELRRAGKRVFDGDEARSIYTGLPDSVPVHRGLAYAEYESGEYGVSWTLEREQAAWFATPHIRYRNADSAACVVSAWVDKTQISGVLASRGEQEVLLTDDALQDAVLEPTEVDAGRLVVEPIPV